MATLERRLEVLEDRVIPDQPEHWCVLTEGDDGLLSTVDGQPVHDCIHHLTHPDREVCDKCRANRINVHFVGGYEECTLSYNDYKYAVSPDQSQIVGTQKRRADIFNCR